MSLKRPTSNESLPATKQLRVAVVSSDGSTSELSEIVDSEASETNSDDSDETVYVLLTQECIICGSSETTSKNLLIFCDGVGICV